MTDYVYEWNGLNVGAGTSFMVERIKGLFDMPAVDSGDVEREGSHGSMPGAVRMRRKVIDFDLWILGSKGSDIEGKIAQVRAAFQAPTLRNPGQTKTFAFQRPGEVKKRLQGRCVARSIENNYDASAGIAKGSVRLECPDPIIYSDALHTQNVALGSGVNVGNGVYVNAGDFEMGVKPVLITIGGPFRNPRVKSTTDGNRTIAIDIDIAAGESLEIDPYNKTVTKIAVGGARTDQYSTVRADSQWWLLTPGNNTVEYSRSAAALNGSISTMTLTWRDGWQ